MCFFVALFLPAESNVTKGGAMWRRARSEVGHIKKGESVIDEAVHGACLAVHVLVDESRDEV